MELVKDASQLDPALLKSVAEQAIAELQKGWQERDNVRAEALVKQLEGEMLTEGQAAVKLQELRRDADANRTIYEQFLARYNATNQQRLLQASQTKVASAATLPTRPTRPPMSLLLAALAILSLIGGAGGVAGLDAYRGRKIGSAEADATAVPVPQPVAEAPPAPAVQAPQVRRVVRDVAAE